MIFCARDGPTEVLAEACTIRPHSQALPPALVAHCRRAMGGLDLGTSGLPGPELGHEHNPPIRTPLRALRSVSASRERLAGGSSTHVGPVLIKLESGASRR
jgi:hypothetical protein